MATAKSTSKTGTTAKKTAAKSTAKTGAKKTTAKTSSTAKKPAAKTSAKKPAAKKPATTSKSSGSRIQVTATEKKLVELYRAADSDTKKAALALLKGEKAQTSGILTSILGDNNLLNNLTNIIPGFNITRDIEE
jgi:hypothetical protein